MTNFTVNDDQEVVAILIPQTTSVIQIVANHNPLDVYYSVLSFACIVTSLVYLGRGC